MTSTRRIIYCPNPKCNYPINLVGDKLCTGCQTPLVYRYLWATGTIAEKIPSGTKIADRYEVIKQQIWLDTEPGHPSNAPAELPKKVFPYLKLYQEQLHFPQVYGFTTTLPENGDDILLLENVPIDDTGKLYPNMINAWKQATPVRQVYWLWQILQLWTPLSELGLAQSLLLPDNLYVQGWCVRLLELHQTEEKLSLQDLGQFWQPWVATAQTPILESLTNIVQQMCQGEIELKAITTQLNQLLLSSAAELPLILQVAGATDPGTVMKHNEDACYPCTPGDLEDDLQPYLSIICDGIDGHEGGEVASQLAVQSLKLQIRALLKDVAEQPKIVPPELLQQQLEASLRVVNNVIWSRNDEQNRQGRERMATTLVMALQVPQRVETVSGSESDNAHELYLASVGDSRAYWITANYCQLLTIDDDLAMREVRLGRSLYRQASQRPDANALTQALGTKEAESLRFAVKRFILEEDGILLLCSDGLSDSNWVEKSWQEYIIPVLIGQLSLEDAVYNWIELVKEKNGTDNISVVLTLYRTSKASLVPITPTPLALAVSTSEELATTIPELTTSAIEATPVLSLAASSQALLNLDLSTELEPVPLPKASPAKMLVMVAGLLVLLLGGTSLGVLAWRQLNPQSFNQMCRQFPGVCSPRN
ncbi:protein phosphatase 2C domain-containing protein [Cronbergia sp. UHCC 0137]|uniref:PP2C family protein-serine/threonine phosphatase n=1 Tax=Cronbergia sp. UHCC 0137 TaxID=3110239 RepID=UPI002B214E9F|nr:protein phosphatase 2C domain-containing protein [Cronbergia sp. UHCC 0137]MEA5616691.1 protein phosphatase 2C domain-containing protein [Cronbergia sp. UHCC 0137]